MSWSLVAHIVGSSVGGADFTTPAINTLSATLLGAFVSSYNGSAEPTLSDLAGNVWTPRGPGISNGLARGRFFFVNNNTPNRLASHTASIVGAANYCSCAFFGFSGSAASPQDQYATQNIGAGAVSVIATPITPTVTGALILGAVGFDALNSALAINSGMTIFDFFPYSAGNALGLGVAWKEQTTIAAIGPTWNWTGGVTGVCGTASFLPGSAPSGPVGKPWNLYQAMRRSR